MPDTEKRVVTTMVLEIDRVVRPADTDLTLPAADADALVESGRARHVVEDIEAKAEDRPDDAHPGEPIAPQAHDETPAEEH